LFGRRKIKAWHRRTAQAQSGAKFICATSP
jgi:hypothetical protein